MEVKSTGVAMVLSFFWTGLGQLYAGKVVRGLVMMAVTPIVWIAAFGGGVLGPLSGANAATETPIYGLLLVALPVAWLVWGVLDARRQCELFNHNPPGARHPMTASPGT